MDIWAIVCIQNVTLTSNQQNSWVERQLPPLFLPTSMVTNTGGWSRSNVVNLGAILPGTPVAESWVYSIT